MAALYGRVNSSVVRWGRSATKPCRVDTATGERGLSPRSKGAASPNSRARWTQRTNLMTPMPKRPATSRYVSVDVSYAGTARSRRATGYGFAMRVIDHSWITNSSEFLVSAGTRSSLASKVTPRERHAARGARMPWYRPGSLRGGQALREKDAELERVRTLRRPPTPEMAWVDERGVDPGRQ